MREFRTSIGGDEAEPQESGGPAAIASPPTEPVPGDPAPAAEADSARAAPG
jgi:hypothetical protein